MVQLELIRFIKKRWMICILLTLFAVDIFLMWVTVEDHEKVRWWVNEDTEYVYSDYLDGVLQNCDRLLNETNLGEITEFRRNNVQHMLLKYSKLKGLKVTKDITDGIELATGESWQLVLQLILVALTTFGVFMTDKGCKEMEIATKRGRNQLLFSRLCVVWILVIAGTIALYGINTAYTWVRVGFGDLSAPIQSLEAFQACPYLISGRIYLLLLLLVRIFAGCLYATIFALCICLTGMFVSGMLLNLLITAGTYAGFSFISDASLLVHIRYASFWTVLNGQVFFQNYLCIPFGSHAIPYMYWTAFCVVLIGCTAIGIICLRGYRPLIEMQIRAPRFIFRNRKSRTIRGTEMFKVFVANRGIIVVMGVVALIALFHSKDSFWMDETEQYYRNYMLRFEGELTKEKESTIQAEWQRLERVESEMQNLTERFQNGEVDDYEYGVEMDLLQRQMIMRSALERVLDNVESVKTHRNSELIYETGIRKFFYEENATKKVYYLLGGVLIVLLCGGIFAGEREQGTSELLMTTKRGRKELNKVKLQLGLAMAFVITVILCITELVRIAETFQIPRLTVIAGNGFEWEGFYKVPLILLVGLVILIKTVIAQFFAGFVMFVSQRSGRTYMAVISGLLMLLIGLVLKQYGIGVAGFAL